MAAKDKTAPIIPILLKYSVAKIWADARAEWRLNNIWFGSEPDDLRTCECGHYPIVEVCVIENVVNGTVLEVGNCCINQVSPEFETLKRMFSALREGRINPAIIDYAHKRGIINDWEQGFLKSVWRKQKFSTKQLTKFRDIRSRIFNRMMPQKETPPRGLMGMI